jgi:hypothetical protein
LLAGSPFITPIPDTLSGSDLVVVKDKILCFVCAVKNIERTFNTYLELQEHLYRDHDMKKDPAMDIFNKYKNVETKTSTAEQ